MNGELKQVVDAITNTDKEELVKTIMETATIKHRPTWTIRLKINGRSNRYRFSYFKNVLYVYGKADSNEMLIAEYFPEKRTWDVLHGDITVRLSSKVSCVSRLRALLVKRGDIEC